MANGGPVPSSSNFRNLEDLAHLRTSCRGSQFESSKGEVVMVSSADQIQIQIPLKVANELHSLKRQDMGNTVTYSLHLTHQVLTLLVEYISHRHQVQEKSHIDLEYEEEWEKKFIKSSVCANRQLLAEFLVAAEALREESLEAGDYTSMLVKMADLIYLYGPSETIVDIIESHSPFSSLSRLQTAFSMLSARFSF